MVAAQWQLSVVTFSAVPVIAVVSRIYGESRLLEFEKSRPAK